MTEPDNFETRLKAAQDKQAAREPKEIGSGSREMSQGIRAFMEMIGVLLGSGLMGWALDRFFGTAPAWLITFVILGICAAIFNLYKLSQNLGTAIGSNSLQSDAKTDRKPSKNESE